MTSLSLINFAAPAMFFGLALLVLPIAAHLLNRHARRRVIFPTIILLSEASASQSQWFKLRRLILLALRCLALLLLVLAFAKPTWRQAADAAAATSAGTAMVLIVDQSASTAQVADGITAFESLRAATGQVLDEASPGDVADIIFAAAQPRAVYPSLTANFAALRQSLETIAPTAERADLPAALAMAGKLLGEHRGDRALVILTDLQATNWADVEARLRADRSLPRDLRLSIVHPPEPLSGNVGLAVPSTQTATLVARQPAHLTVTLTNFSAQEQFGDLDMSIDGRSARTESYALGAWQERQVSFAWQFQAAGEHEIVFAIRSDALDLDNRAYLTAHVVERIAIVVLGDDDPDEPGSATYFIVRALAPRDDTHDRHDVRHVTSQSTSIDTLADAALVFVSYCGELTPLTLAALHAYMKAGGGVVFFCGEGPVDRNLAALDALEPSGLLPWKLAGRRDLALRGKLLSIGNGDWHSALLSAFDVRSRMALSQIRFSRVWNTSALHADAQRLLTFSDGSNALGLRQVAAGTLVVANFSPAWGSSDLAKHGAFVALLHSLVQGLTARHVERMLPTVGHALTFANLQSFDVGGHEVRVVGPDGKHIDDVVLSSVGDKLTVTMRRPAAPGFYRVVQADRTLGVAAVNLDRRERDLRRVDAQSLKGQLSNLGVTATIHGLDDSTAWSDSDARPFWGAVLAAALFVLGLEMALLGYWKR
jgi:hypothetical protein